MIQLLENQECFCCEKILEKGQFVRTFGTNGQTYYFCPEHKCRNYKDLIFAISKLRIVEAGGTPLPELSTYDYILLNAAGRITK